MNIFGLLNSEIISWKLLRAEWDRADTATQAGHTHDRGKLEKIRP